MIDGILPWNSRGQEMIDSITAHEIANSVRMIRTQYDGTIMIVEGETDRRVYSRFINDTQCILISANCKNNAIEAIIILKNDDVNGIVGIIDSDFWNLEGSEPPTSNLLITDLHDLETMILSSNALMLFLSEFGSYSNLKNLDIRDRLLKAATPIGLLRWISSPTRENLELNFKEIAFEQFINVTSLEISINNLIDEVMDSSDDFSLDKRTIKLKINELAKIGHDPWQVCSGHDLIKIFSIGLRNIFGNKKGKALTHESIDCALRLAYDKTQFMLTRLYKSLLYWEESNPPFKIVS
jgi:hypothetical protein